MGIPAGGTRGGTGRGEPVGETRRGNQGGNKKVWPPGEGMLYLAK
jgi:hypothetical protein